MCWGWFIYIFIYLMSFAIKQGLFKLNMTDNHAILGVSIDADPKQIRLKYLKIAQQLHPDKCRSDPNKAELAGKILSKLVNPAYEQLSRKSSFAEQQLVLTQVGKRLAENKSKVTVKGELANELLKTSGSVELIYPKLLKKLITGQYSPLEQAIDNIGIISELNLVYLMLKSDRISDSKTYRPKKSSNKESANSRSSETTSKGNQKNYAQEKRTANQASKSFSEPPVSIEEPSSESRVNAFVNRAQQYISKGEFDQGITELKDALRIDPNHAVAHAVMGKAYLLKNQLTMAKVHIGKAVKADPHNTIVLESKKILDKLNRKGNKETSTQPSSNKKTDQKPPNSGFFSGFFGSKKK